MLNTMLYIIYIYDIYIYLTKYNDNMDVLICWITSYYITLFFYTNLHRCKECHKTLCTLGPVFTGQVCNYLPSGRRFVKQYFYPGVPDVILIPHVAQHFTNFDWLEMFQASEGDPGCVLRGTACDNLSCGKRAFGTWRPFS